jgi:Mrp family chromosome partitioning ATPase/DUF971 family protein
MDKQQQILDALKQIIDPDLNQDIVTLGFVKNLQISENDEVSFGLELTTPACPVKDMFKTQAEAVVKKLGWPKTVSVTMSASKPNNTLFKSAKGLEKVGAVIAVSSCKGGVGKSTVAVNLAFSLAQAGAKVGLFDADVYGPSLPTMVQVPDTTLLMERNWILPLEYEGVKLMSFGYVETSSGSGGPAMMRGPMVSQVINQLLTGTYWGELDYLIIDMPPGTGDIQLTLAQLIPLTAAVIVTTPQHISLIDVVKGVQMFDTLKVPTVAVVENMSYFMCDNCDKQHFLFGKGALEGLVRQFGFQHTFHIPLDNQLAPSCDTGKPYVLSYPTSSVSEAFKTLSDTVVREVSKCQFGTPNLPTLTVEGPSIIIQWPQEEPFSIPSLELRKKCRCAHCVGEFTNSYQIDESKLPADIHPQHIAKVGNYAFGISWSDGHNSLFPFESFRAILTPK